MTHLFDLQEAEAECRSTDGKSKEKDDESANIEAPDEKVKLSLSESIVIISFPISLEELFTNIKT